MRLREYLRMRLPRSGATSFRVRAFSLVRKELDAAPRPAVLAVCRAVLTVLTFAPDSGFRRAGLRAGLRRGTGDLRVHADIVQGPGQDGHPDRARFGAAGAGIVVVVALGARDGANDQPYDQDYRSDAHYGLRGLCPPWRCESYFLAIGRVQVLARRHVGPDAAAGCAVRRLACRPALWRCRSAIAWRSSWVVPPQMPAWLVCRA